MHTNNKNKFNKNALVFTHYPSTSIICNIIFHFRLIHKLEQVIQPIPDIQILFNKKVQNNKTNLTQSKI